jgi:hypothetical protein
MGVDAVVLNHTKLIINTNERFARRLLMDYLDFTQCNICGGYTPEDYATTHGCWFCNHRINNVNQEVDDEMVD